ncbi:uncharacterized protein LOC127569988 [Pristis pectinata]|uniref:uncharacterized protein LOC127569988 n=1 Tax=Pristis pectinata TaxID=685728 RepID=UPI00223DFCD6|nr:uncharacterized protein LOC127569988 [Pristis pectinata]
MCFILHATVLLALSMNVLPCVNEFSKNATLGEDILLGPNCTDCDAFSIEWKFSSNSISNCIFSYIATEESSSETIFGTFKGKVNILSKGLHLWLPSVHFNNTGKYTRILTKRNGMELCVSITVNVHGDFREAETFEINQTKPKDNNLRTTIYLSVSIVGVVLGVAIILAWIKRKSTGRATSSANRFSLSTNSKEYPIYGNWRHPRYI